MMVGFRKADLAGYFFFGQKTTIITKCLVFKSYVILDNSSLGLRKSTIWLRGHFKIQINSLYEYIRHRHFLHFNAY